MNFSAIKLVNLKSARSITLLTLLTLLTLSAAFLLTPKPSQAAGGTTDPVTGSGTTTNGSPTPTQNPLSNGIGGLTSSGTNNYSSGSYNFGSYSSGSSCGIQGYINTNYGNGNASSPIYSSQNQNSSSSTLNAATSIQTFTLGAGIIFNSQKCLDPRKQLETQERIQTTQNQTQLKQTQFQICGPQRTELVKTNPTITKERLDEVCPL
jgi:hypothetical protein